MRNFLYSLGFVSALLFAVTNQATTPNFAGTWTLDKSKSQVLASSQKSFDRVTWSITQTDKQISIEQTYGGFIAGKDSPPPRPGRGGSGPPIGARIYNLDGSENTVQIARTKFTRKAILSNDGQTLELIEKETFPGAESEVTRTTTDKLSLSADGKVLTVIRNREGWPPPHNSTLVFNQ